MSAKNAKNNRFALNVERNEKLYRLWKEGKTIREATALTGYPEGSVTHYWNKFNRAARKGEPIIIGGPSKSSKPLPTNILIQSYLLKMQARKELLRGTESLDPLQRLEFSQRIRYMDIYPTEEEQKAYLEWLPSKEATLLIVELLAELQLNSEQSNPLSTAAPGTPDSAKSSVPSTADKSDFKVEDFLPHWETDQFGNEFLSRPLPDDFEFLRNFQRKKSWGNSPPVGYRDGEYEYFLNDKGVIFRRKLVGEDDSDKLRPHYTLTPFSKEDKPVTTEDSASVTSKETLTNVPEGPSSGKMTQQTGKESVSAPPNFTATPSLPLYLPVEKKEKSRKKI